MDKTLMHVRYASKNWKVMVMLVGKYQSHLRLIATVMYGQVMQKTI